METVNQLPSGNEDAHYAINRNNDCSDALERGYTESDKRWLKTLEIIMKHTQGFTLVEMLVVLAIISILLTLALPDSSGSIARTQIQDSLKLIEHYQPTMAAHYAATGEFPVNNEAAGIPEPDQILGNFVSQVVVGDGAFHLQLGNKARLDLVGKWLSVRPIYVQDSPLSPVSWVCGNDSIPEGMRVAGDNQTDISPALLPLVCR